MSPVPQRKTDGGFDEKKFTEIQMAGFDGFGGFDGVGCFYFVLRTNPEPVRFRRAGDGGGDINPRGADSHHDGHAHTLAGNGETTWTTHQIPTVLTSWSAIAYGNGVFVAAGSGSSAVETSPDGITWTGHTIPITNTIAMTYGNGKFVALGANGAVATSP